MEVRLRPLRPADLEPLWAARQAEPLLPGRVARGAKARLRERIARSGRLVDGFLDLGVEVDGRLVGDVQARQPRFALPPGVFEIGITLFAEARGRGYGRRAVELLADLLFREHDAERVQASTAVDNAPMRRVLERLGWAQEGVLRGFWPEPGGGRSDYVLYALTRADWEAREGRRAAAHSGATGRGASAGSTARSSGA